MEWSDIKGKLRTLFPNDEERADVLSLGREVIEKQFSDFEDEPDSFLQKVLSKLAGSSSKTGKPCCLALLCRVILFPR